jgi:hypothetical protein
MNNQKLSKFWKKVIKCDHKWSPRYNSDIACFTLGCFATEKHCLKCGVYEYYCQCGDVGSGLSGWSDKRWKNFYKNKNDPGIFPNIEQY